VHIYMTTHMRAQSLCNDQVHIHTTMHMRAISVQQRKKCITPHKPPTQSTRFITREARPPRRPDTRDETGASTCGVGRPQKHGNVHPHGDSEWCMLTLVLIPGQRGADQSKDGDLFLMIMAVAHKHGPETSFLPFRGVSSSSMNMESWFRRSGQLELIGSSAETNSHQ
jgi:hypothetical protein